MGLPGRDDRTADGDWLDAAILQTADEFGMWRWRERTLFFTGRRVEKRTILGYDLVEELRNRKDSLEVGELAPGDKDQFAAGILQALQGSDRLLADDAVM